MGALKRVLFVICLFAVQSCVPVRSLSAQQADGFDARTGADVSLFGDALAAGWQNWSWDTTVNLANSTPVHAGSASLSVQVTQPWGGFYLHADPAIPTAGYSHLRFWGHGGASGGQTISVVANNDGAHAVSIHPTAGIWTQVVIALSDLGSPVLLSDLYWQDASGAAQPVYYLDDIELVNATSQSAALPDATGDRVLGQSMLTLNGSGSGLAQLHGPAGLAIGPDGRLFVADYENNRIVSWPNAQTAKTGQAADMALDGTPTGLGFLHPESVAVDVAGNLYIADTDNQRVVIYGAPVSPASPTIVFGEADPADCFGVNQPTAKNFCYPRGLALDTAGNLYVVDEFHHRVKIYRPPFSNDMAAVDALGQATLTAGQPGEFLEPRGVAVDSQDHVFVADSKHNRVVVYDSPSTTDKSSDWEIAELNFPIDLAVDGTDRLYVSDLNSHRVVVYGDPRQSTAISTPIYGAQLTNNNCDSTPEPAGISATATSLHCPLGLAVDTSGSLYVADFDNNRVLAFDVPGTTITLTVDIGANRHAISPYIYGMNFADEALADELDLAVNRWGGNATSRYNYQTDIGNHASDWYFENIKESNATDLPADSAANRFIEQNQRTGTDTLLTLPMSGYVTNDVDRACGFGVQKYGAQQDTDPYQPDCGNGLRTDGTQVTGNNPMDTSVVAPPSFVAGWVDFLKGKFGRANAGGVRFYNLDNEPDLWFETHRDVQPIGWKYQEFRDRTIQYAAATKAADPAAQLLGPAVMGWTYYWYGAYDGQREDWATPDDRLANGDMPFVPWYLQQMKAYEDANGVRLLDYLDLHYYPQASGVSLSPAGNAATQALRLRSTRSLWDPSYVDESWIRDAGPEDGIVKLIPRMKAWVTAYYSGTKLALTEYNWGALDHINGALAQAEVLGIFGREGLDLATLWAPPAATEPGAFAFRMYRNYDGKGGKFGDTSIEASSTDTDNLTVFAAQRSADGVLTMLVINKTDTALDANLRLVGVRSTGNATVYRYSPADLTQIVLAESAEIVDSMSAISVPAQSISLVEILLAEPPLPLTVNLPLVAR